MTLMRILAHALLVAGLLLGGAALARDLPDVDEPGLIPEGGLGGSESPDQKADPTVPDPGALKGGGFGSPTPSLTGVPSGARRELTGEAGGALLFEKLDEDYFVTADLFGRFAWGPLAFGLWVPLRFRVIDEDPEDDAVMRDLDWDEVSDYGRLLRFLELTLGGEGWYLRGRFGAFAGESLGHGTIVGGYYNSLDRNHYRAGLALEFAIRHGGVQFLLDNLLSPRLFGFRLHLRPAGLFSDHELARRLVVGFSLAADTAAPVALAGAPVLFLPPARLPIYRPMYDDEANPVVARDMVLSVFGFDIEYAILQNKLVSLVPYLDLNVLADVETGVGLHLGAFLNFYLPTPIGPTIMARLEYRAMSEGYAPVYFDSLYEAQRFQYTPAAAFSVPDIPLTKLGWLRRSALGPNGWLGSLFLDIGGWVQVGGSYEDYDGPDNASLMLSLVLPKLKWVQVSGTYIRRGFDGLDGAFDLDGALLTASARVMVYGPLFLTATYQRSWYAQDDGSYRSEGDFSAGAGVAFGF